MIVLSARTGRAESGNAAPEQGPVLVASAILSLGVSYFRLLCPGAGEVVLDMFAGTGTTEAAVQGKGRFFVGLARPRR
jgi:hypothetical protein